MPGRREVDLDCPANRKYSGRGKPRRYAMVLQVPTQPEGPGTTANATSGINSVTRQRPINIGPNTTGKSEPKSVTG